MSSGEDLALAKFSSPEGVKLDRVACPFQQHTTPEVSGCNLQPQQAHLLQQCALTRAPSMIALILEFKLKLKISFVCSISKGVLCFPSSLMFWAVVGRVVNVERAFLVSVVLQTSPAWAQAVRDGFWLTRPATCGWPGPGSWLTWKRTWVRGHLGVWPRLSLLPAPYPQPLPLLPFPSHWEAGLQRPGWENFLLGQ